LRVFANRVLRRIFGPKGEKMGGWRKLLNILSASNDISRVIRSRRMKWTGYVACTKEIRNAYKVMVGKPEGKRSLGRPRRSWKDNIRMDLREIGWEVVDSIHLG